MIWAQNGLFWSQNKLIFEQKGLFGWPFGRVLSRRRPAENRAAQAPRRASRPVSMKRKPGGYRSTNGSPVSKESNWKADFELPIGLL